MVVGGGLPPWEGMSCITWGSWWIQSIDPVSSIVLKDLLPGYVCWLTGRSDSPNLRPSELHDFHRIFPSHTQADELWGRVWKHWDQRAELPRFLSSSRPVQNSVVYLLPYSLTHSGSPLGLDACCFWRHKLGRGVVEQVGNWLDHKL
jgi:hypothetical protein